MGALMNVPRNRSIPACAGEPNAAPRGRVPIGVYPRVCGGTVGIVQGQSADAGLSPRVRGNRAQLALRNSQSRSIPACAGEPRRVQI